MLRMLTVFVAAVLVTGVRADTIILKDGTFVEGEIVLNRPKFVRVKSQFATRTYKRKDIERIVPTTDMSDPDAVNDFAALEPAVRAVLNAQAEYNLKRYDQALSRLEPFAGDETLGAGTRIRIDWLIIEIHERMAHWDKVLALLEDKENTGTPRERVRAKAHIDILNANEDKHDLRVVGEKRARDFITDEDTRNRAKEQDALKDRDIMRLALEEYCEQLLVEDKLSVRKFWDKLNIKDTYEACKKLPRIGDVDRHMPYYDDLKAAEHALYKAQSILGDYGRAFELDLLRAEVSHLLRVFDGLNNDLAAVSPETFTPGFNPRTGRLTRQGREQWQARCDAFLERARPLSRLVDYVLEKVERYPHELRFLNKFFRDFRERLDQTIKSVKKARSRDRA